MSSKNSLEIVCIIISIAFLPRVARSDGAIRLIEPSNETATSAAVVVSGSAHLAHTAQLLPLDEQGHIAGRGQAAVQVKVVFDRLAAALDEVHSGYDQLVKLNIYAAQPEVVRTVQKLLPGRIGRSRPAVSFVIGNLVDPDASVALDAVAVVPSGPGGAIRRVSLAALAGQRLGASVAVLPAGAKVYISGQAEPGDSLAQCTRKTLESLRASLTHLGLDKSHVVQLKSFVQPISAQGDVEKEVAAFFGEQGVPPLAFVAWRSPNPPIEIELVAAAGPSKNGEALEYLTPPALKPSPLFSRVARINHGDVIYVSSLYGAEATSGREQTETIFQSLERVVRQAGGDLRHLGKATYYVSDDDASRALNDIRPRYYDPLRPPAASKAMVAGVGLAGRSITLDMIAVPAAVRDEGPPECGHGLTLEQADAGWISLFDGATTFGWSGANSRDGRLLGGTTKSAFCPCAVRAEVEQRGTITVGGRSHTVSPGTWTLADSGGRGPVRLGEGVSIRCLVVQQLGLTPIFDASDLSGWTRGNHPSIAPEKRPNWEVAEGALRAQGGPGAFEYRLGRYGDMVLQVAARTRSRYSNSGVFFRAQPGLLMMGYEAQIYNRCEDGNPACPARYATGAIDDRQNARRLVSRDFRPFTMTIVAHGPHLATWVNGHQVTDWTDTRPKDDNPRQGLRTEAGTIQLQAHDPRTDVEFRAIRVRDLGGS